MYVNEKNRRLRVLHHGLRGRWKLSWQRPWKRVSGVSGLMRGKPGEATEQPVYLLLLNKPPPKLMV